MKWSLAFLGLALCLLSRSVLSQTVIKTLPGFPGELPFYLETGYVGVGDLEDVQMFYCFVKSERSPKDDPLVLWITGGPGCSTLSAILYEIGPSTFNYKNLTPSRPTLKVNEYSWTKVANIIFVDEPVGAGFSYANNWESYNWLTLHPEFLSNPLYIGGDSYGGFINPIVTLKVAEGIEAGLEPIMNLKGYLLGNPVTNLQRDENSRVRFAYLKALISEELYKSADKNCNGDFINVNESNAACVDDLKIVTMCLEKLDIANILEPNCLYSTPKSTVDGTWDPSLLNRDPTFLASPQLPGVWCRGGGHTAPEYKPKECFAMIDRYIGVGELEDVQLFYYFVESERSPEDDPLVLWLTGGPGCSALSGLLYEIGPFTIDYGNSTRWKPTLRLNPFSWTKVIRIDFFFPFWAMINQPVGTGFSYSNNWESYNINDNVSAAKTYEFLRKWLKLHPEFLSNPLYIAGDSYSGIIVPMVTLQVAEANKAGLKPRMNLEGYVLGNPLTNVHNDYNSRVSFAHLKALISEQLYESANADCNGDYINVNKNNVDCVNDLKVVTECLENLYMANILEPNCAYATPKSKMADVWDSSLIDEDRRLLLFPSLESPRVWCRSYNYLYSYAWASDKMVQDALHIREGTIEKWVRCNETLSYTHTVKEVIDIHKELIKRGVRALIYSGDHDMVIPYVGTQAWIDTLNLTIYQYWHPWFVDGQVAGYATLYSYLPSLLTYATVKGGGHTAPEYKPRECFAMINRWFDYYYI
ncbi:hypothetical protein ACJRO7_027271 [Eucalyptus globulus]|uniref:Serine carboxypeptidase-like 18 n=1 Tax=Eucalyptus globulus TaxID=34317 RepID=A0ABD3JVU0_EUCGL